MTELQAVVLFLILVGLGLVLAAVGTRPAAED